MSISPLAKKLFLKPGHRILLLGAPVGHEELLEPLPEGATVSASARGVFDGVLLFVHDVAELKKNTPRALKALKPDALFWVAYPKKSSGMATDLSRDAGWEALHEAGFEGVALIAVDDVWSMMRFRQKS